MGKDGDDDGERWAPAWPGPVLYLAIFKFRMRMFKLSRKLHHLNFSTEWRLHVVVMFASENLMFCLLEIALYTSTERRYWLYHQFFPHLYYWEWLLWSQLIREVTIRQTCDALVVDPGSTGE